MRGALLLFLALAGVLPAQSVYVQLKETGGDEFAYSVSGQGCSPGIHYTYESIVWQQGAKCTVSVNTAASAGVRLQFLGWDDGNTDNPRTFTVGTGPVVLYRFTVLKEYNLVGQANPYWAGEVSGGGWYRPRDTATFTATPNPGFRFDAWVGVYTDSFQADGPTLKFVVKTLTPVTANFLPADTLPPTSYTFLPTMACEPAADSLNDRGQIACGGNGSIWLWTPAVPNGELGSTTVIPAPGCTGFASINSYGQIFCPEGGSTPFLWTPDTPNGATGSGVSLPPSSRVVWNDAGLWVAAPTTPLESRKYNRYGQALIMPYTGSASLFTPVVPRGTAGITIPFPYPANSIGNGVIDINDGGAVLGFSWDSLLKSQVPWVWTPAVPNGREGTFVNIKAPAGYSNLRAADMNDRGEVVGLMDYVRPTGTTTHPFLFSGGKVYDLRSTLGEAYDPRVINNAGQILFRTADSHLATPKPPGVPATPNAVRVTLSAVDDYMNWTRLTVSGTGCQPGMMMTPAVLRWAPGISCTVGVEPVFQTHPRIRYVFAGWSDGSQENPRVFTAPAQALSLQIRLRKEYLITTAASPPQGGTLTGGGWIPHGTDVMLTATPAPGYRYLGSTDGAGSRPLLNPFMQHIIMAESWTAVFTNLPVLPSSGYSATALAADAAAYDINDYGQVLLTQEQLQVKKVMLWTPALPNGIEGTLTYLTPGMNFYVFDSLGLNNRGQVTFSDRSWPGNRQYLWSPVSPQSTTGSVAELAGVDYPGFIGDFGQIAGYGKLWMPVSANATTGTLYNRPDFTWVADVNNVGQILMDSTAGPRLFTPTSANSTTGTFVDLPPLSDSKVQGRPVCLTNNGWAIGFGSKTGVGSDRMWIWKPATPNGATGTTTEIPLPPPFTQVSISGANDAGDIVGALHWRDGSLPFLYRGGVFFDASSLCANGCGIGDINNKGQIILTHGVLATPLQDGRNMRVSATEVRFGGTTARFASQPQPVTVSITGPGAESAFWSASANQAWIAVAPSFGTGSGQFTLDLRNVDLRTAGTLEGLVTVTSGSVTRTVRVLLTITPAAQSRPPFGTVDVPRSGAKGAGAVALSGWALDDVETLQVEIWRKAVPGEASIGGQVYIGNATFVDGARPDVAGAYAGMPLATRAGWGLQVLSNVLPNAAGTGTIGNGDHQFFVYAKDREGNSALIGSAIVKVDNLTSTLPFGTLDRPANGEAVFGSNYKVWGWALTPKPGKIPNDRKHIALYIDGKFYDYPVYDLARSDIASLFPDFLNSLGPVGYSILDTTKLTVGLHAAAWGVTDDKWRTEGMGSRYFFVTEAQVSGASAKTTAAPAARREGIWFRTGFNPDAELVRLDDRAPEIGVQPGGRVEIHLPFAAASVELDGLARPPAASTLDREAGAFYWQVHPAFHGRFELTFRDEADSEVSRVIVRVE